MSARIRVISVATACLAMCASARAKDYEIRLHQPDKVGDVERVKAQGSDKRQRTVTVEGDVVQKKASSVEAQMSAVVKTLAVDKNGKATRQELTVQALKGNVDNKPVPSLPAGSVISAARTADGKTSFQLKGGTLSPEAKKLLKVVATLSMGKSKSNDDVIFGTSERKKVGDQWTANNAQMAKDFSKTSLKFRGRDLTSKVKLAAARKVRGVPCLHIVGDIAASHAEMQLPKGAKVVRFTMKVQFDGDFPLDVSLPTLRKSMKMSIVIEMEASATDGRPATRITVEMSKSKQRESTPLPGAPTGKE